jgi:GNAT superfamily N-acetyltransferase
MPKKNAAIVDAIEVFVRGFAAHRSRTHPYVVDRVGKLWWLHDRPQRKSHGPRKDEWVAFKVEPSAVDAAAREHSRGRYCVSAMFDTEVIDDGFRAEYKQLGYRLTTTESLFVQPLKRIPRVTAPAEILRLKSPELAIKFAKATRSKVMTPAQLADDALRQYVAVDGTKIVGWVCSLAAGDSRWCSNMQVLPSHRRRGIGKALLAKMLRDDRTLGARQSVLLATHAGAKLYPHVGYQQVGSLAMFVPKRRS